MTQEKPLTQRFNLTRRAWKIVRSGYVRGAVTATLVLSTLVCCCTADDDTSNGDQLVTEYFRKQTKSLTDRAFADIETLEDWTNQREERRRQLFEMLGLDPLPKKTPLQPVVTSTVEENDFIVENLHFQSQPGLYVTANLYRPKEQTEPLPAILYVCGHGRAKQDGISYGNKTQYQHHGAWFARNGYVCLTIDTIQLGEIEGIHHGTYREKMWWWNNRGYTPAGVEAWNCIRSLDYLQSREEVDPNRIGVTGRSGGGAYSWWVSALDERISVAVPVAGITSLKNHVVDGCVEGHCDCMYMVNTYRWDYPMVAALVAPRPLLISNTDKDRIFPLDGVIDVHAKVRKIYRLYGAEEKLGLQITEGPHKDTQELRIHAFRWLNRFLKDDDALIEKTATKFLEPGQLKVFETLPADERVTSIHESFVPTASRDELPETREEFLRLREQWMKQLNDKTFGGWPEDDEVEELNMQEVGSGKRDGVAVRVFTFTSQSPYRLSLFVVEPSPPPASKQHAMSVFVQDQHQWESTANGIAVVLPDHFGAAAKPDDQAWARIVKLAKNRPTSTLVYIAPRGVGSTQWSHDEKVRTHIRRRFMQLGQTADGMKIWDIRRALQALEEIDGFSSRQRVLRATGNTAALALYASLFEDQISRLDFTDLPTSNRDGITLLNVSRFVEMPHLLLMAADRVNKVQLFVQPADENSWSGVASVGKVPSADQPWFADLDRIRIAVQSSP